MRSSSRDFPTIAREPGGRERSGLREQNNREGLERHCNYGVRIPGGNIAVACWGAPTRSRRAVSLRRCAFCRRRSRLAWEFLNVIKPPPADGHGRASVPTHYNSGSLSENKLVAVQINELSEGSPGHPLRHLRELHAASRQFSIGCFHVFAAEHDGGPAVFPILHQGARIDDDARQRASGGDFNPSTVGTHRFGPSHLKPELLGVETERLLLVGHIHRDILDVGNHMQNPRKAEFPVNARWAITWAGVVRPHPFAAGPSDKPTARARSARLSPSGKRDNSPHIRGMLPAQSWRALEGAGDTQTGRGGARSDNSSLRHTS